MLDADTYAAMAEEHLTAAKGGIQQNTGAAAVHAAMGQAYAALANAAATLAAVHPS